MKRFLFLISLLPFLSVAGMPEEDFVIDAIRDAFQDGSAPSESDLLPGKAWVCGMYDTKEGKQSGTVGVVLGGVKFKSTNEGLFSSSAYHTTDVPYEVKEDSLASFRFYQGMPFFYHFVRKVHDGLIVERAAVASNVKLASIINPRLHVTQYSYCVPYDYVEGRKKIFNRPHERILKY